MKKILETIIGLACLFSLVIAGGERPDGSCDVLWTTGWLFVALALVLIMVKFFGQDPVHITQEAYIEIQRQLQDAVDGMNEGRGFFSFDAELPDEMTLFVTVELYASSTKRKFTDEAWGRPETFTEINWVCECRSLSVLVLDKNGKTRKDDFDVSQLELRYESMDWK